MVLSPLRGCFVVCLISLVSTAAAQSPEDALHSRLAKEPLSDLARAVREQGDAGRGAVLFFQPFLACAKCHDAELGSQLGPDIAKAGDQATAEQLIESVLLPSRQIKQGYEPVTVSTTDGRVITGLLVKETDQSLELIDPAGGKRLLVPVGDIDQRSVSAKSLMPEGLVNLLSDRQQFLDLAKYLIEVAEGGPNRARELRPALAAFALPEYEQDIDHAKLIRRADGGALKRGEAIYARVCANCHGTKTQPGSLPNSPRFANHTFKNGSAPHSLYQTLTRGYNLMAPQTWMVPQQKYDVIHYLRESYLKGQNPSQYTKIDDSYLAQLPEGKSIGPAPASVEPWMAMDYGPSLMNTYEVGGPGPNIAYKGLAVRLNPGGGGVSRGSHWSRWPPCSMSSFRPMRAWTASAFCPLCSANTERPRCGKPRCITPHKASSRSAAATGCSFSRRRATTTASRANRPGSEKNAGTNRTPPLANCTTSRPTDTEAQPLRHRDRAGAATGDPDGKLCHRRSKHTRPEAEERHGHHLG